EGEPFTVCPHAVLGGQLGEVGADRQLGGGVQRRIDVGVDPGDHLGGGAVTGGEGCQDLGFAQVAVVEVLADLGTGGTGRSAGRQADRRPVARVEAVQVEGEQGLQGAEVGAH